MNWRLFLQILSFFNAWFSVLSVSQRGGPGFIVTDTRQIPNLNPNEKAALGQLISSLGGKDVEITIVEQKSQPPKNVIQPQRDIYQQQQYGYPSQGRPFVGNNNPRIDVIEVYSNQPLPGNNYQVIAPTKYGSYPERYSPSSSLPLSNNGRFPVQPPSNQRFPTSPSNSGGFSVPASNNGRFPNSPYGNERFPIPNPTLDSNYVRDRSDEHHHHHQQQHHHHSSSHKHHKHGHNDHSRKPPPPRPNRDEEEAEEDRKRKKENSNKNVGNPDFAYPEPIEAEPQHNINLSNVHESSKRNTDNKKKDTNEEEDYNVAGYINDFPVIFLDKDEIRK